MPKHRFLMLGFAPLLCQIVSELFVWCCLVELDSTHLVHLLELLKTVGGDGLRSVVVNKW